MKTLKKVTIVLEDGEALEVRCGDVSLNIDMGYASHGVDVRVQRPPTDGRYIHLQWSELVKGEPTMREADANGWLALSPIGEIEREL